MNAKQIQGIVGVVLLVAVIGAFVFEIIVNLPTDSKVAETAQTIPAVPSGIFASDSATVKKIQSLKTPSNVPVVVDPNSIGRADVFKSY